MKIQHECLIAVLEAVENASTYHDSFRYLAADPRPEKLGKYSHDEILYHFQHCSEQGYLQDCSILGNGAMIAVGDLSIKGHAYLKEHRNKSFVGIIKNAIANEKESGIRSAVKAVLKTLWQLITPYL